MQDLSVMKSAAPRDAASGMPTGKRQHIDKAVPGARGQMFAMNDVVVSSCAGSGTERTYEFRGHVTLMK